MDSLNIEKTFENNSIELEKTNSRLKELAELLKNEKNKDYIISINNEVSSLKEKRAELLKQRKDPVNKIREFKENLISTKNKIAEEGKELEELNNDIIIIKNLVESGVLDEATKNVLLNVIKEKEGKILDKTQKTKDLNELYKNNLKIDKELKEKLEIYNSITINEESDALLEDININVDETFEKENKLINNISHDTLNKINVTELMNNNSNNSQIIEVNIINDRLDKIQKELLDGFSKDYNFSATLRHNELIALREKLIKDRKNLLNEPTLFIEETKQNIPTSFINNEIFNEDNLRLSEIQEELLNGFTNDYNFSATTKYNELIQEKEKLLKQKKGSLINKEDNIKNNLKLKQIENELIEGFNNDYNFSATPEYNEIIQKKEDLINKGGTITNSNAVDIKLNDNIDTKPNNRLDTEIIDVDLLNKNIGKDVVIETYNVDKEGNVVESLTMSGVLTAVNTVGAWVSDRFKPYIGKGIAIKTITTDLGEKLYNNLEAKKIAGMKNFNERINQVKNKFGEKFYSENKIEFDSLNEEKEIKRDFKSSKLFGFNKIKDTLTEKINQPEFKEKAKKAAVAVVLSSMLAVSLNQCSNLDFNKNETKKDEIEQNIPSKNQDENITKPAIEENIIEQKDKKVEKIIKPIEKPAIIAPVIKPKSEPTKFPEWLGIPTLGDVEENQTIDKPSTKHSHHYHSTPTNPIIEEKITVSVGSNELHQPEIYEDKEKKSHQSSGDIITDENGNTLFKNAFDKEIIQDKNGNEFELKDGTKLNLNNDGSSTITINDTIVKEGLESLKGKEKENYKENVADYSNPVTETDEIVKEAVEVENDINKKLATEAADKYINDLQNKETEEYKPSGLGL